MERAKQKLPKFLDIDQLEALEKPLVDKVVSARYKDKLKEADKIAIRDFAVLTLTYACALRISEALNLKLNNIIWDKNYAYIINSKGDDRTASIPEPVIAILKEWLAVRPKNNNEYLFCNVRHSTRPAEEGKPLGRDYYNKLISRLADETGVRMRGGDKLVKPHPHTLRHTRAVNFVDNGVDINIIQKILGHKNLNTTLVYANVRQEKINKVQQENLEGIINI